MRIYVEKVGTREKIRPEYDATLADLRPPDTLTVTMLDRMDILGGPLSGMYDPQGAGKVLFVVFAAMAEVERESIHERTWTPPRRTATTAAALRPSTATCSPSPSGTATPRNRSP